jgi:hypothetical protein
MAMPSVQARYRLSFVTGGLFLTGAPVAAELFKELGSWVLVRSALDKNNLLQARTSSSATRLGRELIQRLQELSPLEIELLSDSTADERAQLMWVAACRRYTLIAEFAEEVLRERFLLMAPNLLPEHFEAFVRGKSLWHPELADLKESTLTKLRTTTFLMMREAEFLTPEGQIVPAVVSSRLRAELDKQVPSDVRLLAAREAL